MTLLIFGSDYQHEERNTTFQSISCWNASATEPSLVEYAEEALTTIFTSESEELVNYLSLKLIPN